MYYARNPQTTEKHKQASPQLPKLINNNDQWCRYLKVPSVEL
jgi:hypothetical protein